MLERVWGKTMLVFTTCGSLNWPAIREISIEESWKTQNGTTIWPSYATHEQILRGLWVLPRRCPNTHAHCFTGHHSKETNTPRCLSTSEHTMQLWHIYIMGFHSDVEKNEVILFSGNCIDYWKLLFFKLRDTQQTLCAFLGSQSWSSFPNCHWGVKAAIDKVWTCCHDLKMA